MPQIGQAQTGSLKSTPKQLKIAGSDISDVIFKCMGNNHYVPFMWSATATLSGAETEVTLASGTKFYNMDLASYATVTATPTSNPGGYFWIEKDTTSNVIKLVASTAPGGSDTIDFELHFSLGASIDISELNTRGTGASAQSYP